MRRRGGGRGRTEGVGRSEGNGRGDGWEKGMEVSLKRTVSSFQWPRSFPCILERLGDPFYR